MLKDIIASFSAPKPSTNTPDDARIALAALMVRLARADGDYAKSEITQIDQTLKSRFGLSTSDAQALRKQGETLEENASDTVRFTRSLKQAIPYEEREEILELLWAVALVDGTRAADENAYLRLVTNLLGISDVKNALARQRAESKL